MADLSLILEELAAGKIDAAEAARRIDAANAAEAAAAEPRPAEPTNEELGVDPEPGGRRQYSPYAREVFESHDAEPEEEPEPAGPRTGAAGARGVERIVVRAVGRRVRIVGDSRVATAAAEGPHVLRRRGAVLEVTSDGEVGPNLDGFSILRLPHSLDDLRSLGLGKELVLKVNPAIELEVEVTAGSLTTVDVPYLGKVRVTAGGAELSGIRQVEDVLVQAGSATVQGEITSGRSRIRVESGQLTVDLTPKSDVTVHAEAQLGRVSWPGSTNALDEVVLGQGSARLDVGVVMGWATIKADLR